MISRFVLTKLSQSLTKKFSSRFFGLVESYEELIGLKELKQAQSSVNEVKKRI